VPAALTLQLCTGVSQLVGAESGSISDSSPADTSRTSDSRLVSFCGGGDSSGAASGGGGGNGGASGGGGDAALAWCRTVWM
jgi:hypothetical protein